MKINRLKFGIAIVLMAILFIVMAAPQADAQSWKQKFVRFSAVAGETLATGNVVCILSTDSQAYLADADVSTLRPAVGVVAKGGLVDTTVEIVSIGIITGMTAASPGVKLYLSATPGAFSTAHVTNEQILGWVLPGVTDTATSTTYFIMVTPPVSVGGAY